MSNKKAVEDPRLWSVRWIEQLTLPQFLMFAAICSVGTCVILSQLI